MFNYIIFCNSRKKLLHFLYFFDKIKDFVILAAILDDATDPSSAITHNIYIIL